LVANSPTEADIRRWCTREVAQILEIAPEQIDPGVTFARLGLDSANSVQLIMSLEEHLGIELDPEMVFDYPTIAALARQLAFQATGKADT
jgi:acyl carrier protein